MSSNEEDILYDVLVLHEWPDHPAQPPATPMSPSHYLSRFLSRSPSPLDHLSRLTSPTLPWRLCATPDLRQVAIIHDSAYMELLAVSISLNVSYSLTARVELPPDAKPERRLAAWDPEGNMLAVATGEDAKVLVFDALGNLMYELVSNSLKGEVRSLLFPTQGTDAAWKAEVIVCESNGMAHRFLLSDTGYQEKGSVLVADGGLHEAALGGMFLYVAGTAGNISRWRLTDEEPFFERTDAVKAKSFWFSSKQDPIYFGLQVSPSGSTLAAISADTGSIVVFALPSMRLQSEIPLTDQACYDDVNPVFLKTRTYVHDPLKFWPCALRWWNEQSLVVTRQSGGLSVIDIGNPERNLLGESAEFFSPNFALTHKTDSGLFIVEVEIDKETLNGTQLEEKEWAWAPEFVNKLLSPPDSEKQNQARDVRGTYRLLHFQSTSPVDLFQKKIDSEEYGEAIILARHFNLDCDDVYVRQWQLSDHLENAVTDFLQKVNDVPTLIQQCLVTQPTTVDATRMVLQLGLNNATGEAERELFGKFLQRLQLFEALLEREEDFSGEAFVEFRNCDLVEYTTNLALDGNISTVQALIRNCPEVRSSDIASAFPESVDPLELNGITLQLEPYLEADWYVQRTQDTLKATNQTDFAVSLLNMAVNMNHVLDRNVYHKVSSYDGLVFNKQFVNADYPKMLSSVTDIDLVSLFVSDEDINVVFKSLILPLVDRIEQCQGGTSYTVLDSFITAESKKDFMRPARLVEALAMNREDTWLKCEQIADMAIKVAQNAPDGTDPSHVRAFSMKVKALCPSHELDKDFSNLLKLVTVFEVIRGFDNSVTMEQVVSADADADAALGMIDKMANTGLLKGEDPFVLLSAALQLASNCSSLNPLQIYKRICLSLLQSKNEKTLGSAISMMNLTREDDKTNRLLQSLGVSQLNDEEKHELGLKSAWFYFECALSCKDISLDSCRHCLQLCERDNELSKLLEAIDRYALLPTKDAVPPTRLREISCEEDLGVLIKETLNVSGFNDRLKSAVLDFGSLLAKANEHLKSSATSSVLLTSLAEMVFEDGDHVSCLSLCKDLQKSGVKSGWKICWRLIEAANLSASESAELGSYTLSLCSKDKMDELLLKTSEKLGRCDRLHGYTFSEQSWTQEIVLGNDVYDLSEKKKKEGGSIDLSQEPFFGVTFPEVDPEWDAKVIGQALHDVLKQYWLEEMLSATIKQLGCIAAKDSAVFEVALDDSVCESPSVEEKEAVKEIEEEKEETAEERKEEEEVKKETSRLDAVKDLPIFEGMNRMREAGVPAGLLNLSAIFFNKEE